MSNFMDFFDTSEETYPNAEAIAMANERIIQLPTETVWKAIKLLFPDERRYSMTPIFNHIQETFAKCHCCPLYSVSKRFNQLCTSLGLDPKKREVIITSNGYILYTPDFASEPLPIE